MYTTSNQSYGYFTRSQKQEQNKLNQFSDQLTVSKIGLANIGNTCYMYTHHIFHFKRNTVLQAIFNTNYVQDFLSTLTKKQIEKFGQLFQQFYVLWFKITQAQIAPDDEDIKQFKFVLGQRYEPFQTMHQQDCMEFYLVLIEQISKDIMSTKIKKKLPFTSPYPLKNKADEHYTQYYNQELNQFSSIFTGQIVNKMQCMSCRNEAINFEYFTNLCLNIPQMYQHSNVWKQLQEYFRAEQIQSSANCVKCKKKGLLNKYSSLINLPNVLVIQLKRYSFEKQQSSKANQVISIEKSINIKSLSDESIEGRDSNYSLYAVINHQGVIFHGHYTWYDI